MPANICQDIQYGSCDSSVQHQARRLVALMLFAFGDESADETKERVFAVAGVIGSEEQWESLEKKWGARCNGIPFHANDCDSNHGDFKVFSHQQNKDRYRDLTVLLTQSGLGGFGIALDLFAQKLIFPQAPGDSLFTSAS